MYVFPASLFFCKGTKSADPLDFRAPLPLPSTPFLAYPHKYSKKTFSFFTKIHLYKFIFPVL